MGSGRIRMFSLWVMVVILLLLGVDQGHARPFTWPGGPPDYWETPNWANTPPIRKFVDTVAGLDVPPALNNLGQYIPVAVPDQTTYSGSDYYEIALVQYREKMHSDLPPTLLRGYVQLSTSVVPGAHTPLSNANRDGTTTPILINGAPAFGVASPPLPWAHHHCPEKPAGAYQVRQRAADGGGGLPFPPGGRNHHGVGGVPDQLQPCDEGPPP